MFGHHILTLGLFVMAHAFHVQRMGFLILSLLNFSNPFLHCAKILNYLGKPPAVKTPAFMLFAISFAVSRCVIFPMLLAKSVDAVREHLAYGDRTVVVPALVCFTGVAALQLLQFYWMHRIIKCAAYSLVATTLCMPRHAIL
jgi:TLC domain